MGVRRVGWVSDAQFGSDVGLGLKNCVTNGEAYPVGLVEVFGPAWEEGEEARRG